MRTDGVDCREFAGTGPEVLKGVQVTKTAFAGHHGLIDVRLFFTTPTLLGMKWLYIYWYVNSIFKVSEEYYCMVCRVRKRLYPR